MYYKLDNMELKWKLKWELKWTNVLSQRVLSILTPHLTPFYYSLFNSHYRYNLFFNH
jgi:hypothetical protein